VGKCVAAQQVGTVAKVCESLSNAAGADQPPIDVTSNGLARVDPHGIKALSVDTPFERTPWGRAQSIRRRGDVGGDGGNRCVWRRVARLAGSERGSVSVWAANDRCEEHSGDHVDQARQRESGRRERVEGACGQLGSEWELRDGLTVAPDRSVEDKQRDNVVVTANG
jgi:hypothetical protein